MRIDAHHGYTDRYSLDYLETILQRNRFEQSILAGPAQTTPEYVAGIIIPMDSFRDELPPNRKVCGVQARELADVSRAAGFRLPVDLLDLLPQAAGIAAEHPELTFIVDHLGYPPTGTWDRDMERAAEYPNVCCKLSGLARFSEPRPYVRHALALFGPARLMFGSDWPNGLPEHTWKSALALFTQAIGAQTMEVREQMLGATAARIYGLNAGGG